MPFRGSEQVSTTVTRLLCVRMELNAGIICYGNGIHRNGPFLILSIPVSGPVIIRFSKKKCNNSAVGQASLNNTATFFFQKTIIVHGNFTSNVN
jgi:hypothetical protein